MADFLEEKKREISQRLDELRPAVEEFHKLEAALNALEGVNRGGGGGTSAPARRPGRPRKASTSNGDGSRRGRPRGTGKRAAEAREVVEANPGITIPEIAQKMGIAQNYLYRVLPTLEQEGVVRKEGRGWYLKEA